jgi:DNA-binding response OmpR family regulator
VISQIAVDKVKASKFDLVVMELHMPIMDGYTSSRNIRSFNRVVPIIALTATANTEIESKIQEAGMQDFVTKPFNPDELYSKIKNLISNKE